MSVEAAIRTLAEAGAVFSVAVPDAHLSIGEAARRLDCSPRWIKDHPGEFPRMWRMLGGELRVPLADITAMAERRRIAKGTR